MTRGDLASSIRVTGTLESKGVQTEISGLEVKEGMEVVDGQASAATPPAAPTGNIPAVKEFGIARTGPIDTGYEVKGPS